MINTPSWVVKQVFKTIEWVNKKESKQYVDPNYFLLAWSFEGLKVILCFVCERIHTSRMLLSLCFFFTTACSFS